jgi:hypothetical protein
MTAVGEEPALRFWLRYAEREGAVVEDRGDHALLLLPQPLQAASELPEEVAVTADPDVAREDGATLLIPGHPAIERAAAAVLAQGDAGHAFAPWPTSRAPARSALEARARELVPVEHGRLDATGEPASVYVPLLRVGAVVSYSASLALRFEEREEAWVDARTGLKPGAATLATLIGADWKHAPDQRHRRLPADLAVAIPGAHEQLERRAAERQRSLAAHARRARDSELARADAYYQSALESIARRRAAADIERARLLDAQADATRAEHVRRRREIEREYEPSREIRPFRLQLVHAAAFVLPVDVRRGSRRFPFTLTWLATAGEFAASRCPACGAAEALVAGRDGLGCAACAPTRTPSAAAAAPRTQPARPRAVQPTPPPHPSGGGAQPSEVAARSAPPPQPAARAATPRASTPTPARARPSTSRSPRSSRPSRSASRPPSDNSSERAGNKLALAFWQRVAGGERWPRAKTARDSPLRALYRLYGAAGPLHALGIPRGQLPDEATAVTYPGERGQLQLTVGVVFAQGRGHRYALGWSLEAGKPTVGEVSPAPHPLALPPLEGAGSDLGARLREAAPPPAIELDRVAAALWAAELGRSGLPFVVRCLATWWRVREDGAAGHDAAAAAVAHAVAKACGMRRTKAAAAAMYGIELAALDRAAQAFRGALRLDAARGW